MEQIINKARNEYPHNQTQQFYRIIKPFMDSVFANANDNELDSDSFIDEIYGLNVMRNFFQYDGHRYCFWICMFPYLTPEGKKNAFYGIEKQNNGIWQAIWSEAEHNFQLWFRLRVAAQMMDEDELLDFLNPFESAIINAPYNSDIFEERKIITEIIMNYSKLGCADHRHRELNIENQKFKFDLFKLFDSWYLWSDVYENNLLEAFRLDVIYGSNTSFVLFSNISNDEQLYMLPSIIKLFMD